MPERLRLPEGITVREAVAGLLWLVAITIAVFDQLFESSGGLLEPTETSNAVRLAVLAGVALLAALLLAPRSLPRALIALPVLALALLTALTFIVPAWVPTEPDQVTRLGLLTVAYTAITASAVVFSARFGALPVLLLFVLVVTVAGGLGLWGYTQVESTFAGDNQGDLVPQGPLAYRNALALLSAAALIPLGRWALADGRTATSAAISVASGLALGIAAIVVAVSLSEFGVFLSALLVLALLIWPGPSLGVSPQRVLPPLIGAGVVALAAWITYRKLLPLPPERDDIRLTLMLLLVAVTPALIWGLTPLVYRVPEKYTRRAGYGLIGLGVLALFVVALGPGLPTGSAELRGNYYEVILDLLYDEPLAGVGPGNYLQNAYSSQLLLFGTNTSFAHSIPGEAWVELGLAGLFASLLLYVGAFRDAWLKRSVPDAALLAPFVLGFLLSGLIDWSWHIPAVTALWATALGAVSGVSRVAQGTRPGAESGAGPPGGVSSPG